MGRFKEDEVAAYNLGEELVCTACAGADELTDLTQDQVVLDSELEEEFAFCDRCKKRIS